MENINRLLIQLDKAVNCTKSKYPQERAIAIILFDNLIEVQLYKTLTRKTFFNKKPKQGEKIIYRYQDRDLNNYKDILKLASETSIISKTDRELLDLAHSIRNKIYHKGDFYDEDKIDLAMILYYIFLSENFKEMHCAYGFTSYQSTPAYEEIDFGQVVLNDKFKLGNTKEYFEASSDAIFSRWITANSLSGIITTIIIRQIEDIKNSLEFITSSIKDYDYYKDLIRYNNFDNQPNGINQENSKNIDFILLYFLFVRKNRDSLNCIQNTSLNLAEGESLFKNVLVKNEYKYPYWIDIEKIENRIKTFKHKSEEDIVKNFRDIESKIYNMYQDVSEAASALDGYIQYLVDVARGK